MIHQTGVEQLKSHSSKEVQNLEPPELLLPTYHLEQAAAAKHWQQQMDFANPLHLNPIQDLFHCNHSLERMHHQMLQIGLQH